MANITFGEAPGINESIYGKSQEPIMMLVERRAEAFENESVVKDLFNMQTSNNAMEKIASMTSMDDWEVSNENGAPPSNGMRESYSKVFEHVVWKSRFTITREIIDDAKTMDLKAKPISFITAYYRTREKFGAALLGNAIQGNASFTFGRIGKFDTLTADKQGLFSTAHPEKNTASTQSNKFSDAFSNDALMAMESKMQDFRGDNNEVLDVAPNTIIIPNDYAMKQEVFAAIGADKDPATANNGYNYNFGRWNVKVWNYLNQFIASGTKPWLLFDSEYNKQYHCADWFDRISLEVQSKIDPNTGANIWDGYARFTAGFNDWRGFAVGGLTGGTALISA